MKLINKQELKRIENNAKAVGISLIIILIMLFIFTI